MGDRARRGRAEPHEAVRAKRDVIDRTTARVGRLQDAAETDASDVSSVVVGQRAPNVVVGPDRDVKRKMGTKIGIGRPDCEHVGLAASGEADDDARVGAPGYPQLPVGRGRYRGVEAEGWNCVFGQHSAYELERRRATHDGADG